MTNDFDQKHQINLPDFLIRDLSLLEDVAQGIIEGKYRFKTKFEPAGRDTRGFSPENDGPSIAGTAIYEKDLLKGSTPILVLPQSFETAIEAAVLIRLAFIKKLADKDPAIKEDPIIAEFIRKICKRDTLEISSLQQFSEMETKYKSLQARVNALHNIIKEITIWEQPQSITYAQSLNIPAAKVSEFEEILKNTLILLNRYKTCSAEDEKAEILFEVERLLKEITTTLDNAEDEGLQREIEAETLSTELAALKVSFSATSNLDDFLNDKQKNYIEMQLFRAECYLNGTFPSICEKDDLMKGVPDINKAKIAIENLKAIVPFLSESPDVTWYLNHGNGSDIAEKYGIKQGKGVCINPGSELFPLLPGKMPIVSLQLMEFTDRTIQLNTCTGLIAIGDSELLINTRDGKSLLGIAENPNWSISWSLFYDGEITEYAFANAKGIGTLSRGGRFTFENWEGLETSNVMSENELRRAHNLPTVNTQQSKKTQPSSINAGGHNGKFGTFADLMKKNK